MLTWRRPGLLAPVAGGTMFVFSDYSGQHKNASHEAYTFLITNTAAISGWAALNADFRAAWLPDGRELSFKRLNERVRRRALLPFLTAASQFEGNIVTFLVSREVGSFMEGGPSAAVDAFPDCFSSSMSLGTVEKMLRLASFMAFLVAGFRAEDQPCLWLSDADEALETSDRRDQLGRLSSYVAWGLTKWKRPAELGFGTTLDPTVPNWGRDAAALTDLVAGACCKLADLLPTFRGVQQGIAVVSGNVARDKRARVIGDWMATHDGPLRHVLLRLERDDQGEVRASAQSLASSWRES